MSTATLVRPVFESLESRTFLSAVSPAQANSSAAVQAAAVLPLGGVLQKQTEGTRNRALTDLVKGSTGFKNLSGGKATVDAAGWPTQDFTVRLWSGSAVTVGRFNMSFVGPSGTKVVPNPTPASARLTPKITKVSFNATTRVNTYTIDVPAGVTTLGLKFTNTAGQVKELKVLQPGFSLSGYPTLTTKYVNFLKSLSPDTLRMMDIIDINDNTNAEWAKRPKLTDVNYTRDGLPWETLIGLCNTLQANIWICVPGHANDDYVRQLATLVKNTLSPELKIYVEYSNEVWNQGFEQGKYNLAQAKAEVAAGGSTLNHDGNTNPFDWADRRTARRLMEISNIFKDVWTSAGEPSPINDRVRASLGNQASRPQRIDQMLKFIDDVYGPPSDYFWSIGVALYFTLNNFQDQFVNGQWQNNNKNLTKDQVLEGMDRSIKTYEDQNKFAQQLSHGSAYGLTLDAYELGVDTKGPFNIQAKKQASFDARMEVLMGRFVSAFFDQGGSLANWYSLGARTYDSQYGTWTVTDNFNSLNTAKMREFRELRGLAPTV